MQEQVIRKVVVIMVAALVIVTGGQRSVAAAPEDGGVGKRLPWTTSRITGSPEPPLPYIAERAFPALIFNQCLDMTFAPGSHRLFVLEQSGKLYSFPNVPDVESADLVFDFAAEIPGVQQTYALTFHPDFEQNRFCYVCCVRAAELPDGTHVMRFRVADSDPPTVDPASATTIITWLSGGHNGCALKFGPDGCLYISTGDGAGPNPPDTLRTGQDISDLLASILRIDVDHAEHGRNYRIPPDNPFVGMPDARGEVWAYGLRNPWRISFDRETGDLWVGDVGWELWEMLNRVERGGNYGWAVTEGRQSTNPEWPRGPTPIVPPTIEHSHTESSSITEGLTYYGSRLKDLQGTHIYGDYDTGKFWGFRYENGTVIDHRALADTSLRVVGFGEDPEGEFYVLDHVEGTIQRLVPNPRPNRSFVFPRKLSDTGLFTSVAELTPAPGVLPYVICAEPWADDASAERFVAVPYDLTVNTEGPAWTFPTDSVFVKTLSLEMRRGDASSRRRVETQILHYDGAEWMPYTWQWNDEQTDAWLVDANGAERTFEIVDVNAPGGVRRQAWRFAGRAECQRCHNKWSGPLLGFQMPQLNLECNRGGGSISQLDLFAQIGLFEKSVPAENRPQLADPSSSAAELDSRARAYLHANCAHCHRMHAGGSVLSYMHSDLPLAATNMIGIRPTQGTFGMSGARVIAPGDPYRSVLLYRMAKLGGGRMPHIGSTEVDRDGVELIRAWIDQLPASGEEEPAAGEVATGTRKHEPDDLRHLRTAESAADAAEIVDRLLNSTSGALMLLSSVDRLDVPAPLAALAVKKATQHADSGVRDLFERFLPPEQRVRRLGSVVRPEQILALIGDAERGRRLFLETDSVSCRNCHRVGFEGKQVGPDLTTIGRTATREQILESILEPSKRIDPKYVTWAAETTDGLIVNGLLVSQDDDEVILREAEAKVHRLPVAAIEQLVPQRQSLMPDLLFRDLTAQQVADLLAYLSSLNH